MTTLPSSRKTLLGWWLLWTCIVVQQLAVHRWDGKWFDANPSFSRTTYAAILTPLLVSIALRWIVWSRIKSVPLSFVVFIGGLVLAAMSGLSVTFLDVPYKQSVFILCLAVILSFAPIRSKRSARTERPSEALE